LPSSLEDIWTSIYSSEVMSDIEAQHHPTPSRERAEQTAGPSTNAQNEHVLAEAMAQEPPIHPYVRIRRRLLTVLKSFKGTIPEKRQPNDYTSPSFYKLPEPMPVSDVLLARAANSHSLEIYHSYFTGNIEYRVTSVFLESHPLHDDNHGTAKTEMEKDSIYNTDHSRLFHMATSALGK
jgi:hypothetical protein